jgi:hypothetical protein
MICTARSDNSVQPNEFVLCMGIKMEKQSQLTSLSLLPAEHLALTACISTLLTAIGSLLQEHPDLQAGLSKNSGQFLITIAQKLAKVSTHPGL